MALSDDLGEIKRLLIEQQEQKKSKKFRIPFGKKVSNSQKRKNYITAILIGENNSLDFKKIQIENQSFMLEGIPRLAGAGYIMYYKKTPFIILPKWSIEPMTQKDTERLITPYSPGEDYELSLKDMRNTVGWRILFEKMQVSQIDSKKKMGGAIKWILGIGLAIIVGYALVTGGA